MLWRTLILLVLIGIGATGYFLLRPEHVLYPAEAPVVEGRLARTLLLPGEFVNHQTVTVTSLTDGQIESLAIQEGMKVKLDETVAKLNSDQIQGQLRRATAQLALEQQRLTNTRARFKRVDRLAATNNVSRHQAEDAAAEVDSAKAMVEVARADVALAELRQQQTVVSAPFAGTIIKVTADEGQWVEAGTPLFTLAADVGQVVEAVVDAASLSQIRPGQPVELQTEAWPDQTWQSEVEWIAPALGSSTIKSSSPDTFAIRMPPGENAPALLIGQELDVILETAVVEDALILPLAALQQGSDGDYFVWVDRQGRAARLSVEIGLITLDQVQIVSGPGKGDSVLVPNGQALYDGVAIEPR